MGKKLLVLPLLQIKSGHHQAADALIEYTNLIDPAIECEKIDILHYSYGKMEAVVSSVYLKWIHYLPFAYSWIYRKSCGNFQRARRYRLYELLFLRNMQKLIREKRPDYIFCTHALPSYLLGQLKSRGLLNIPVINVYTDYFINDVWGRQGIDYHLVPDSQVKQWLTERAVPEERIIVTGIPIHPEFAHSDPNQERSNPELSVLITGGNLGTGAIKSIVKHIGKTGNIHYIVLCGKNNALYRQLQKRKHPRVAPMPYIESKEEMNNLYNRIDAIVTKPGGVTISECLYKKIPVFVYHALPGQEEINLQRLLSQQLIFHLRGRKLKDIENRLIAMWQDEQSLQRMKQNMDQYCQQLSDVTSSLRRVLEPSHSRTDTMLALPIDPIHQN
ncbi:MULTISPECIES: glycosyltransferase [unclassified Paenibacillus]|uniref:MGDG synthase family glycosyltransferase n=1 Tax=unclassified Paenibacillus TaxID=185978 RepID=UPI001C118C4A|nr:MULTISPECIES: glycosyltransferase [unclassified Paenibacillus]MBU5443237.1 UDP-glucuronosyltransferase [Paenibacillus sp. MSJ-34]CAH0121953.1 Processive diacylglycerol beta-glucosyltransferase [Paenibacillus sp. CECT 9249]